MQKDVAGAAAAGDAGDLGVQVLEQIFVKNSPIYFVKCNICVLGGSGGYNPGFFGLCFSNCSVGECSSASSSAPPSVLVAFFAIVSVKTISTEVYVPAALFEGTCPCRQNRYLS